MLEFIFICTCCRVCVCKQGVLTNFGCFDLHLIGRFFSFFESDMHRNALLAVSFCATLFARGCVNWFVNPSLKHDYSPFIKIYLHIEVVSKYTWFPSPWKKEIYWLVFLSNASFPPLLFSLLTFSPSSLLAPLFFVTSCVLFYLSDWLAPSSR